MFLRAGMGAVVLYVVVLVAVAAVSGFMLGQRRLRWTATAVGVALAFFSAFVLRRIELDPGIGIPAVAAVLAISQAAYLIGLLSGGDQSRDARSLPRQQIDDVLDESRDREVHRERDRHQHAPFHAAKISQRREMPVG
jgi:predicted membrane channel-forming protein YqfA (hemolysin III family)